MKRNREREEKRSLYLQEKAETAALKWLSWRRKLKLNEMKCGY